MAVVGDEVGERNRRGRALGVVGVVALDRRADRRREAPAANEHAADQGVVDPELAALGGNAILGGLSRGEEVRVAGVEA